MFAKLNETVTDLRVEVARFVAGAREGVRACSFFFGGGGGLSLHCKCLFGGGLGRSPLCEMIAQDASQHPAAIACLASAPCPGAHPR